ncbi:MAG: hypothetical protein ACRDN9_18465 [Streptosporangiaceae bacterium]
MSDQQPPPGEDARDPREPWRDQPSSPSEARGDAGDPGHSPQPEQPYSAGPGSPWQRPPPPPEQQWRGQHDPPPYYGGQYGQGGHGQTGWSQPAPQAGQSGWSQYGQQQYGPQRGWAQYGMLSRPPMPEMTKWATNLLFVLDGVFVLTIIVAALTGIGSFGGVPSEAPASEQAGAVVGIVLVAIILGGLFLWLAIMTRKGRNWARITSTVLLALGIISALSGLGGGGPVALLYLIQLLIEIAVLVLLWLRPSREYFGAVPRSG